MSTFKFGIMGAGKIAVKFCEAVSMAGGCEVCAVSSKSHARATEFAKANNVPQAFNNYEQMLSEAHPDCVYIATTPDSHCELALLCLEHNTPVICEKAMFIDSAEARRVFELSRAKSVFVMEAMWSRFLPANIAAKRWLDSGRIGHLNYADIKIGFIAPKCAANRYFSPRLGGGAAHDITVYAYELARFFIGQPIREQCVQSIWSESGVDAAEQVSLRYDDTLAMLATSFVADFDERTTFYGDSGRIVVPHPHYANEAFLYSANGELIEHFTDDQPNGFIHEVREVVACVRAGAIQSTVVPHQLTLDCAELFDTIAATNPKA